MKDELLFSYIDGIPFKEKSLIDEVERKFRRGHITVKGKKISLFSKIEDWYTIKVYRSGKRIITPFCLKSTKYKNQLHLTLDKKALPILEMSLNLARRQLAPFASKYTIILAHWISHAGSYLEVDKKLFRKIMGVTPGYSEPDIKSKILIPSVKELQTVLYGLQFQTTEDSYIFTR